MNAEEKELRSGPPPAGDGPAGLAALKACWAGQPEEARAGWRELFASRKSRSVVRAQVRAKLNVYLAYDLQLAAFREWLADQDRRELAAERLAENARQAGGPQTPWTMDEVRGEMLRAAYCEALASGDFALGLKTVREDLNVQKAALAERKLALQEKKAQAEAAGAAGKPVLSAAEKEAAYRRIFGMG